jgi:hypothetical protein
MMVCSQTISDEKISSKKPDIVAGSIFSNCSFAFLLNSTLSDLTELIKSAKKRINKGL